MLEVIGLRSTWLRQVVRGHFVLSFHLHTSILRTCVVPHRCWQRWPRAHPCPPVALSEDHLPVHLPGLPAGRTDQVHGAAGVNHMHAPVWCSSACQHSPAHKPLVPERACLAHPPRAPQLAGSAAARAQLYSHGSCQAQPSIQPAGARQTACAAGAGRRGDAAPPLPEPERRMPRLQQTAPLLTYPFTLHQLVVFSVSWGMMHPSCTRRCDDPAMHMQCCDLYLMLRHQRLTSSCRRRWRPPSRRRRRPRC